MSEDFCFLTALDVMSDCIDLYNGSTDFKNNGYNIKDHEEFNKMAFNIPKLKTDLEKIRCEAFNKIQSYCKNGNVALKQNHQKLITDLTFQRNNTGEGVCGGVMVSISKNNLKKNTIKAIRSTLINNPI